MRLCSNRFVEKKYMMIVAAIFIVQTLYHLFFKDHVGHENFINFNIFLLLLMTFMISTYFIGFHWYKRLILKPCSIEGFSLISQCRKEVLLSEIINFGPSIEISPKIQVIHTNKNEVLGFAFKKDNYEVLKQYLIKNSSAIETKISLYEIRFKALDRLKERNHTSK